MTVDPIWNMAQAAEAMLMRVGDLIDDTVELQPFLSDRIQGGFSECLTALSYLRSAVTAYKEAMNDRGN